MTKKVGLIFIIMVLSIFLCGCGAEASSSDSADTTGGEHEETVSFTVSYLDMPGNELTGSGSTYTKAENSYDVLNIVGIDFEIPQGWNKYDDSGKAYFGYYVYPERDGSKVPYYFSIGYIPLEGTNETNTEKAMVSLANRIRNIDGCENYSSYLECIRGKTSLRYSCTMERSVCSEYGCFVPVYDMGVISVFYSYLNDYGDLYTDEFDHLVQTISIKDEEAIVKGVAELRKKQQEKGLNASSVNDSAGDDSAEKDNSKEKDSSKEARVVSEMMAQDDSLHHYYLGITAEGAQAADLVAKQIADSIMSNQTYTTDLQRVSAAAEKVAVYCGQDTYGMDSTKYYRSPYGVFVAGVYTCAGSTRALGRVLDYMGYSWQHTHENENRHQWCVLTMDGQTGFADGMSGIAGYGVMTNGMTLPDGRTIHFTE